MKRDTDNTNKDESCMHDEFEYEMRNGCMKKKIMTSWNNLKERKYAQESRLANKKTEKKSW